jgi:hypothetical protein
MQPVRSGLRIHADVLHPLSHLVLQNGERDLFAIGLALGQRFRQVSILLRGRTGRHGWLMRIDNRLDQSAQTVGYWPRGCSIISGPLE